ncbi:hypothetical protein LEP1GSC047_3979 [Leptospira inadai serovar Lyme str. 10]|uniref:Uncharacterized protein n=2 Tax=Leptospira inadai serovar Lyme TaxID=293084 RepID=V6HD16_9LEPT|nr:hypothetical protein LEP1GSC047_3979 [Leptospira inadai serovar Lyme str. 10]PNV75121.1 hypothetical protein BES34_009480 [Leptospira inadai serovar Lyme]
MYVNYNRTISKQSEHLTFKKKIGCRLVARNAFKKFELTGKFCRLFRITKNYPNHPENRALKFRKEFLRSKGLFVRIFLQCSEGKSI